ncbi:MAG: bifunctional phosphopantothenoylcysteine decarboxylase/phosphopantothenate--cysteine ligase CoaBC [Micavibrio sp.]
MLNGKKILLIISGGIAAYKSLELIRLLKKDGASVRCILTRGGAEFITPLSVASLSGEPVYTDLFSLKDETEMGHIRLSREADLVLVAPASANMMAKMAHGMADDLAAAALLATDKPVMVSPAMNPMMWDNAATQANIATLRARGIRVIEPSCGAMACGESGAGRLPEAAKLLHSIRDFFLADKPLAGRKAIVTSGPTHEPVDPVRYIANRSSGKQGHAIAKALSALGASVTLVSGPTTLPDPAGLETLHVTSAKEMMAACQGALPADIAVCAAAVADWAPDYAASKIKKNGGDGLSLPLTQNPDILAALSARGPARPRLVVGFAAETDNILDNARGKLAKKGCDWVVANSVSAGNPVFGADENQVYFLTQTSTEEWPRAGKDEIARTLAGRIAEHFSEGALKIAAE